MMCCVCGEAIELGDLFIQVTQFRLGRSMLTNQWVFEPFKMEDGSSYKFAHGFCPATNGAPLSLVGADIYERSDV